MYDQWNVLLQASGKFRNNEKQLLASRGLMKNKAVMPFVATQKQAVEARGPVAFDRKLGFDEMDTLQTNMDFIRRELSSLKVTEVQLVEKDAIVPGERGFDAQDVTKAESAVPGHPTYRLL